MIDLSTRHDKQDRPESTDEYLVTFIDDITKALMNDITRGGYAIDTKITGNEYLYVVEGESESGISVTVEILYRHLINDTTQQ